MNILVVEDTPINLRLLRRQLEAEGHKVMGVGDGVEALAILEREPFDAIISDILMPRMDGYRLCYEVRRNARIRNIQFVLYSGTDTSPADEKLGREVGADAFISKFDGVERILALFQQFSPRPRVEPGADAAGARELEVIKRYSEHFLARMDEHVAELRQRTVEMEREISERQTAQELIERSRLALLSALEDQKLADDSRRKAMAETERHLALLETCFDTLAEGVIICDLDGNVFSWNRAALEMHGFANPDECHRRVSEFQDTFEVFAPNGALVPFEQWPLPRILRGETLRNWEALIRRKKAGWERWFSYSGCFAKDKAGKALLAVVSIADVTERRKTEASLRLFRAQIERANDAIEVVDPGTGRFLDMNQKGCLDLGYTREEILSLTVLDIDPALNFAGFAKTMKGLNQISSARFETLHRRKDGTTFPVEVSINQIRLDRDYVVAVSRNITERRRGEEALDRERSLLRTVVDLLPDHIYVKDVESRFLLANNGVAQVMGVAKPECLIGKSDHDFYPEAESAGFRRDEQNVLAGRAMFNKEEPVTHPDGSQRFILTTKVPIADADGNIIGLVGIGRDVTERKRIEEALRASEERLSFALETSRIGAWDLNLADNTIRRTLLHDRVFGYETLLPGWSYGMFLEHVLPEDRPEAARKFHDAKAAHAVWNSECRIRRADGEVRWIWITGGLVRNPEGLPERMSGIVQDITERKQAEEKARSSEDLFGKAFRASPAAILFSSLADGRLIEANDAFVRMFGFENREQIIGRTGLELGVWDNPADRERLSQAVQQSGSLRDVEAGFRRKSGERGHALASIEMVDLRGERCVLSLFHDITARKRAEADLQRSLSLLTATLESTDDGILALDIEGKVVSFNQRFVDLWRIPAEVVASHDDNRVLALAVEQLQDAGAFLRKAPELGARPEPTGSDTLQFKDGRVFERYSHPQRIDGQTVGHVWSFRDVTERRRLEGQLRQVQKMESVGQLAAGIAHDFNNLLTVIQCYGDLLGAQLADRPQAAECVNEITAAGERAANLTRQLLLFSRKEVARRRLLDLNDLTGNLVKMLGRILGEDIALRLDCWPSLPPVHADPGMIEQVITNLSVNARDAMPEGGRLEITTSVADLDAARVLSNPEAKPGCFVCLAVSDTGSGIPPEIVLKIFEPFFTTKEVGKGTGLGLATVYGIVMQHQGVVEVSSQPGEGACFRIFLPASSHAQEAATGASTPAPTRGGSETVLLVEDEAVVLFLVEKILTRAGYTVLIATSGPAAQTVWQDHREKIDMLLTDMIMPGGFSGKQLADSLRSQNPGLRVIFMSGYSPELRSRDLEIKEGLNFLQKPFSPSALLEAVRRQLDSRS